MSIRKETCEGRILQLPGRLLFLIAPDHLHEGDGGDRITGKCLAVGRGVAGDGRIHSFGDVREDVGIEERFVQRSNSRQVSSRRWR